MSRTSGTRSSVSMPRMTRTRRSSRARRVPVSVRSGSACRPSARSYTALDIVGAQKRRVGLQRAVSRWAGDGHSVCRLENFTIKNHVYPAECLPRRTSHASRASSRALVCRSTGRETSTPPTRAITRDSSDFPSCSRRPGLAKKEMSVPVHSRKCVLATRRLSMAFALRQRGRSHKTKSQ